MDGRWIEVKYLVQ